METFNLPVKKLILFLLLVLAIAMPIKVNASNVDVNTDQFEAMIKDLEEKVKNMKSEKKDLMKINEDLKETISLLSLKTVDLGVFRSTAYDLSIQSCGKPMGHKYYGITASGYSLEYQTRESAMAIAVDPKVIPLGTKVYIEFDEKYSHFNGIYTAVDTGGSIKGRKIDLFMGDFRDNNASPITLEYGVRNVRVYKIVE